MLVVENGDAWSPAIRIAGAVVLLLAFAHGALAETPCEEVVCIDVEKSGKTVTFYAVSRSDGVSVSFSVSVVNMEPRFPPVVTRALPRGRTELMTLATIPGKKPDFVHAHFWEWGVAGATHDDRVNYRLPFESGKKVYLFHGPNGPTTHQGQFAFDFPMPLGTPVCAARGGMVTEIVDQYDEGGPGPEFGQMANVITIVHEDGTLAEYVHLLRGGMRVRPGDHVEAGTIIGLSGNSGMSSGPHLHFAVFRRMPSGPRETLPVKFLTTDGAVVLEPRTWYRVQ